MRIVAICRQNYNEIIDLITPIDEQIVYNQLDRNEQAIWSLLVTSGDLKVLSYEEYGPEEILEPNYELTLTKIQWMQPFYRLMSENMKRH